MKIKHRTNGWAPDRTDPGWAERVEREAELVTARTEALWLKAQRRLERAETKARSAAAGNESTQRVAKLWAVVEKRRADLASLERVMTGKPGGSFPDGHRHVATGRPL